MVWCNYMRKINVKFFWGEKDILRSEKNLSMKILHIIWFDIRIYKVVCSTNGNVLNKKFWPWVRICFIPCCWFHVHTWVHTPIQMLSSQHSLNIWHWLGLTAWFCASFSFSWGSKTSKINLRPKVAYFVTPWFLLEP